MKESIVADAISAKKRLNEIEQKNGSLMTGIEAPKDIRILRTEIMNKPFKLKK
jgi:sRNA-binding carbon storage regulator CsrA